ncbi:maestro heat-like repeat-containing protein family member 7 isoform X2 [Rhinolophus ferrumequinum]|uniref:maestro heat-like repeat-containing protein family member 7 isoform X2 n=1 Tax=Rhinolophus ferrumequinum TaxID=59479 RepID=UPI00140FB4C7|nr:maestro heat-like repeat-containing protein family member 7 isoform X2 [Rhinolophus ferrumequinum]
MNGSESRHSASSSAVALASRQGFVWLSREESPSLHPAHPSSPLLCNSASHAAPSLNVPVGRAQKGRGEGQTLAQPCLAKFRGGRCGRSTGKERAAPVPGGVGESLSPFQIILPWLTMSEKMQEQTRALGTIAHLLRFICNFPKLLHMTEFSISGKLMGTLGLFCMNPQYDICMRASEGLLYLFQVLVLQRRGMKQKTELILKELQKHFHGEWFVHLQDLTMCFRKYLTPEERADVIMVAMEAMTSAGRNDDSAASKILEMILKYSVPAIGKVPEIVQYIYHNLYSITETTAQDTVKQVLLLLAQTYTDEVILTLFKMQDRSPRGARKPWGILASCPRGYQTILEHLLQRLTPHRKARGLESGHRGEISALIATRAIHELLLEPSRRTEVQTLFPSLIMALLFQTSFLVVEGGAASVQDHQHFTEWMDSVSSTVEALKTLMQSTGYGDHVSHIQKFGGWELLTSPDRHYDGVTLLARALVTKNCWHNQPIFSVVISDLQGLDCTSYRTALVFMAELLRCPNVAAIVDDITVYILADGFHSQDPTSVKLLLRVVETFAKHGNMGRQLRLLQPFVLNCCFSLDGDIVTETFLVLQCLVEHLTWQQSSSFLVQLTFTLGHFFEEESEHLRSAAFAIYAAILAKVKRRSLIFPLKHQVLNSLVLLVLHLQDRDTSVAQNCRQALCHKATILGWSRLKAVFAEKDMWTILRALLEKEAGKALWFLKQCVSLFKSPQAPIRQAAVWFAGQIIQTLDTDEAGEIEEAHTALWSMRDDPDPAVSCLATQTFHIVEAKEKLLDRTQTSCFCLRRPWETGF